MLIFIHWKLGLRQNNCHPMQKEIKKKSELFLKENSLEVLTIRRKKNHNWNLDIYEVKAKKQLFFVANKS